MTRFRWGSATDIGRVRSANQDAHFAAEGFFVVADGMGGHNGGEVASSLAIESLTAALPYVTADDLLAAVQESNREVYWRAVEDASLRGMGTTLCVLAAVLDGDDPALVLANVGDSRIYRFLDGNLEQMTEDHSMVAELQRQGRITAAEAATHPQRNILTRALGIDPEVHVDAWRTAPDVGTRWVLCSDGLFNEVDEPTIVSVLGATDDPSAAAAELVRLANEGGGRDNITVVVVDVLPDDDAHAAPLSTAPDEVVATGDPTREQPVVAPADDAVGASAPAAPGPQARSRARRVRLLAALVAAVLLAGAVVALLAGRGGDGGDDPPSTTVVPVVSEATTVAPTSTSSTTTSTTTSLPATTTSESSALTASR